MLGADNPLVAKLLETQLAKLSPEKRQMMETLAQQAREQKASQPTAADLGAIAERVTRSDARSMLAMEKSEALDVLVRKLQTQVLELTSALTENTATLKKLRADLGA